MFYFLGCFVLSWNNSHIPTGIVRRPASQYRHALSVTPTNPPAWDCVRPRERREERMVAGLGIVVPAQPINGTEC